MTGKKGSNGLRSGLLMTGTMIGAGFASGKELVTFFGTNPIAVPIVSVLVGLFFFLASNLLFRLGEFFAARSAHDLWKRLFGRGGSLFEAFFLVSCFLVLSAMLAGTDALFVSAFSFPNVPIASVLTLTVAFVVLKRGLKGMVSANTVIVPAMIGLLVLLSVASLARGEGSFEVERLSVLPSVSSAALYVAMNVLLAFVVLTDLGRELSRKEAKKASAIGSVLIASVVAVFLLAISFIGEDAEESVMPILALAARFGKVSTALCVGVIWCGIFTTLLSVAYPPVVKLSLSMGEGWAFATVTIASVLLSTLGFSVLVEVFYPLMSIFGIILMVQAYACLFGEKKREPVRQ